MKQKLTELTGNPIIITVNFNITILTIEHLDKNQ